MCHTYAELSEFTKFTKNFEYSFMLKVSTTAKVGCYQLFWQFENLFTGQFAIIRHISFIAADFVLGQFSRATS